MSSLVRPAGGLAGAISAMLMVATVSAASLAPAPPAARTAVTGSGAARPAATHSAPDIDPTVTVDALAIEPAGITARPDVTLHPGPPANGDPVVRISNDGTTWMVLPYSNAIPWSLIGPAGGGVDADGAKTVRLEYGDGSTWSRQALGVITLDRQAPVDLPSGIAFDGRLWSGAISLVGAPSGDVAANRISLDGITWQPWTDGLRVDLWSVDGAGTWWTAGNREIAVQLRDSAGNASEAVMVAASVSAPHFPGEGDPWDSSIDGVVFDTPLPAISGQPFTIDVVYPAGYTMPDDAWCQWVVNWGDDAAFGGLEPNPTWGELFIERAASSGACSGWTFTLPYRTARQFFFTFTLGTKTARTLPQDLVTFIYQSSNHKEEMSFRALDASRDEHIATSTIPFIYLLPETTVSRKGVPVTYRMHAVGTNTIPQTGLYWTSPLNCYMSTAWMQQGGLSFTFTPNCDGPWVTGWTGTMYGGYMRSQYDPLVDGTAPHVRPPTVSLRTGGLGTSAPAVIRWSGSDRGSGVYRYALEVSRNGGAWRRIDIPWRLSTSTTRWLATSGTYRFRVNARDRVGNWSGWVTGPSIRVTVRQESSTLARWSGAWSTVAGRALSGGAAKTTDSADARSSITTTARSLAWVARKGPGMGLAQVWVDGMLAATVDLGAPVVSGRTVVFATSWATAARHTLRIVPLGTAGRPTVEVDAFLAVP